MKRTLYIFLKVLVVGLGVGYALRPLFTAETPVPWTPRTLLSPAPGLAFGAYALGVALLPLIWWKILDHLEIRLSLRRAYQALLVASMGRYIPGKVFHVVGRISFLPDAPATRVAWSVLLESVFLLLGSCILGAGYLWGWPGVVSSALGMAPILWISFSVLGPLVRRWPALEHRIGPMLPVRAAWLIVMAYTGVMAWIGLAAWIWSRQVGLNLPYLRVSGAFALSFVAGYLAVLAPAGLGIRESGLVWLLKDSAAPAVSLLAWMMRLTALGVDLAMLLVGLAVGHQSVSLQKIPFNGGTDGT